MPLFKAKKKDKKRKGVLPKASFQKISWIVSHTIWYMIMASLRQSQVYLQSHTYCQK